jgi:hypothetical protein
MAKNEKIKFLCLLHNTLVENSVKAFPLACERGELIIKEFPPREECLFFCHLCSTYIAPIKAPVAKADLCPNCEKNRNAHYLCADCLTLSSVISEIYDDKYSCSACRNETEIENFFKHNCERLGFEFFVSREECPFCKKTIYISPAEKVSRQLKIQDGRLGRQAETIRIQEQLIGRLQEDLGIIKDYQEKLERQEKIINDLIMLFGQLSKSHESLKSAYDNEIKKLADETAAIDERLILVRESAAAKDELEKLRLEILAKINEEINKNNIEHEAMLEASNEDFNERIEKLEGRLPVFENKYPAGSNNNRQSAPDSSPPVFGESSGQEFDDDFPTVSTNVSSLLEKSEIYEPPEFAGWLVSKIKEVYPDMEPLVHYPLVESALKKNSSKSESPIFYRLESKGRNFAIPSSNTVQNESQFKHYSGFYGATTTRLNGKIRIVDPAMIQWDEVMKGYICVRRGIISIS